MRKSTRVYLKNEDIYIVTNTRTIGMLFTVSWEPIYFLKKSDPALLIGQKVLDSLAAFQENITHGPQNRHEWAEFSKTQNKKMGIKSRKSFYGVAKSLSIDAEDEGPIVIVPKRTDGKGGFDYLEEKKRTGPRDPQALGEAILLAFDDCA